MVGLHEPGLVRELRVQAEEVPALSEDRGSRVVSLVNFSSRGTQNLDLIQSDGELVRRSHNRPLAELGRSHLEGIDLRGQPIRFREIDTEAGPLGGSSHPLRYSDCVRYRDG